MLLSLGPQILALDDRLLIWANQFAGRWPELDRTGAWLLSATLVKFAPIMLVLCWFWFDRNPQQAQRRARVIDAIACGLAALFVGRVLALALPFRERPLSRPELHFVSDIETTLRTWSAFPSDHAVMGFAFAAAIYRLSPRAGWWVALHAAVVICLPRFYFGLHHPSDLLAGALVGVALVTLLAHLSQRRVVTDAVLRFEQRAPGAFYAAGFLLMFELAEMFASLRSLVASAFRLVRVALG